MSSQQCHNTSHLIYDKTTAKLEHSGDICITNSKIFCRCQLLFFRIYFFTKMAMSCRYMNFTKCAAIFAVILKNIAAENIGLSIQCNQPLISGEELNVSDSALSSSSDYDSDFTAPHSRIDSVGHAWSAGTNTGEEWIQVIFGETRKIVSVITKGGQTGYQTEYVTSYTLSYRSRIRGDLMFVIDSNGDITTFDANVDENSAVENFLRVPLVARIVRLYPEEYVAWPSMRWELTGCIYDGECGDPANRSHASVMYTGTRYTHRATYTCESGYTVRDLQRDNYTVECLVDGSWGPFTYVCEEIDCYNPPLYEYTVPMFTNTTYRSNAAYLCDEGTNTLNCTLGFVLTCLNTGMWSEPSSLCYPDDCGIPEELPHSDAFFNETTYQQVVTYECHAGYRFPLINNEIANSTCLANASWSYIGSCEAVNCFAPPYVNNTEISYNETTYGSNATYYCRDGYYMAGAVEEINITCMYTGLWEMPEIHCIITDCGPPLHRSNSVAFYRGTTYQENATYVCNTGFHYGTVDSTLNTTCLATGAWSETSDSCQVINCGAPDSMQGAILYYENTLYTNETVYICETGYYLESCHSAVSIHCTEAGVWSIPSETCHVTTCDTPTQYNNSRVVYDDDTYQSLAYYYCNDGFYFEDMVEYEISQCNSSGQWTAMNNICEEEIRECGPPPHMTHASFSVTTDVITQRQAAQYRCDSGYWFENGLPSYNIICLPNGEWDSLHTMCERMQGVTCPRLEGDSDSSVIVLSRIVGGVAITTCNHGYAYADELKTHSTICLSSTNWYESIGICQAIHCPPIVRIANGQCDVPQESVVTSQVSCRCNNHYLFATGLTHRLIECSSDGTWNMGNDYCLERCGPLPLVKYTNVIQPVRNGIGTEATLRCFDGYKFSNGVIENTIQCNNNLDWSDIGGCEVEVCDTLTTLQNVILNTTEAIYGTVVNITCVDGYTFTSNNNTVFVECLFGRVWNATVPQCTEVICDEAPIVAHAQRDGEGRNYMSTVTYTCHSNYSSYAARRELSTNTLRHVDGHVTKTIYCNSSGLWSDYALSCEADRCPPARTILNATMDRNQATNGSIIIYTCNYGYEFNNDHSRTMAIQCINQVWNDTGNNCQAVTCSHDIRILHGYLEAGDTRYQSEAMLTCDSGYVVSGSNRQQASFSCGVAGQWNNSENYELDCTGIDCGPPPSGVNTVSPQQFSTTLGTEMSYHCINGYWIDIGIYQKRSVCHVTGDWIPSEIICSEIRCPLLTTYVAMKTNASQVVVGAVAKYECSLDSIGNRYEFEDGTKGTKTTVCSQRGSWHPSVVHCKKLNDGFASRPVEATGGPFIGVIGIIMFTLQIVFVIVLDMPILFEHLSSIRNIFIQLKSKYIDKNS